ncbi:MAG: hypothetical protein MJ078_08695 [Clostridia bacterium]|nr:hypothetical protein [Clostridia bacterium]
MISISKFLSICDDGTILPYPAGQGNTRSRIITAAVDDEGCTFVYHDKSAVFSHFRTKQVKKRGKSSKNGLRSRKIAKKSAVLFVSFSSVKTYRLRGSERI